MSATPARPARGRVHRDRDAGGRHHAASNRAASAGGERPAETPRDPAGRPGPAGARRGPSSRSGARRRCRRPCRRGSTRGTAAGRATPGRRGTSRSRPATGRWPSASGSQIETSRRGQVRRDVPQAQAHARPGRVLDGERLAERLVPAQQRLDEQVVDREPHRAAPVRVAAEQVVRGLAGLVVDGRGDALDLDPERRPRGGGGTAPGARGATGSRPRPAPRASTRSRRIGGRRLRIIDVPARRVDERAARAGRVSSVTPRSGEEPREVLAERGAELGRHPRHRRPPGRIGSRPTIEWILQRHRGPVGQPQQVVEEAVVVVPQAALVERRRDPHRVLEERRDQVAVGGVAAGQRRRHREHRHAVGVHPGGRVGLLEVARHRQVGAVEGARGCRARGSRPRTGRCPRRPRGSATR